MKTCIITGALEADLSKIKKEKDDIVIAADRGYLNLTKYNITPDIILGDFDSLGYIPETEKESLIVFPERKDDTDTLLAVKEGLKRGYTQFLIYGCLGGRLDQTIASVQSAAYIDCKKCTSVFIGDEYSLTVISDGSISFSEECKGKISVFAYGGDAKEVYIKGLSYTLNNYVLKTNEPLGVSNEFTGEEASIYCKNGALLVIWQTPGNTIKEIKHF